MAETDGPELIVTTVSWATSCGSRKRLWKWGTEREARKHAPHHDQLLRRPVTIIYGPWEVVPR